MSDNETEDRNWVKANFGLQQVQMEMSETGCLFLFVSNSLPNISPRLFVLDEKSLEVGISFFCEFYNTTLSVIQ